MTIRFNGRSLREAVWGRESYGLLLVLLLVNYVILTLVNSPRWGGLARTAGIAVTVLFSLHTSSAHPRMVRLAQLAVVTSLVLGTLQAVTDDLYVGAVAFFFVGILLVFTPVAILRRVLPKESVDLESIFAAVDVYIIIGLIYSVVFIGIAHIAYANGSTPFLAQPPATPHTASDYVYLSFVTLTTVGFGDLTPLSDVARSVVVLEALMGQIFLVTLVARLVSLYGRERRPGGPIVTRDGTARRASTGDPTLREGPASSPEADR